MAINLAPLSPITTAATALSNLVLVTPQKVQGYQPQNAPNADGTPSTAQPPPAMLFHYEGEQSIMLVSDITDHYIEDNTAVADNIALRPEEITTNGFIGELNNVPPPGLSILKTAAEKLTAIGAYAPQLSATALLAYSEAMFLYQTAANVANTAVAAWSSIGDTSGGQSVIGTNGLVRGASQNKQQVAFQQFYGYWASRTLFTVQTPWAVFQNMAIKSLRAIQDAETNVISDFEVTFKRIRQASTITTSGGVLTSFNGRASQQASPLVDLGTSSPTPSIGLGSGLSSMGLA